MDDQTPDPVSTTGDIAASESQTVEQSQDNDATHATPEPQSEVKAEPTLHDAVKARHDKLVVKKEEKKPDAQDQNKELVKHDETPKYEPNFKYKAFGKEKELDPFWRDLIKDPDSEKKVKEIFTRADAFDDMKQRYEGASSEFQRVSKAHQDLDRDVKRVMHFRNSGDLDNFFASVDLRKDDIYKWAARQIELDQQGPEQRQQYEAGVYARAENLHNQTQYQTIQAQMAEQQSQMMRMQLDYTLNKPEVMSVASTFDQRMGDGEFQRLVIGEAANNTHMTGQVWTPEQAVNHVIQKFGRLLESPQPQATAQAPTAHQNNFQQSQPVPQTKVVQGKPVIPNVNGRGTSPVKQAPKSIAQLREMGRQAQMAESQYHES